MVPRALAAVALLAVILGASFYLYEGSYSQPRTQSLQFALTGGSASIDSSTGLTNLTVTLSNTGTVSFMSPGESGIAPPPPFAYVQGTYHGAIFGQDGTQVEAGNTTGSPVSPGGKLVVWYMLSGAAVGSSVTVSVTIEAGGQTSSHSLTLIVVQCQGNAGCHVSTTSSTTTTSSSKSNSTSSSSTSSSSRSTTSTSTSTQTSTTSSSTTTSVTTTATSTSSTSHSSTSTSTTATTQTTSGPPGTLSFVFLNSSATFDSASGQTTIHLALKDTGSINILPKYILDVVPSGTTLVPGTWTGDFYSSGGVFLCSVPHGCSGGPPDTSNGGTIIVTFQVTGAAQGETLTLTYSIFESGLTATGSTNILVT